MIILQHGKLAEMGVGENILVFAIINNSKYDTKTQLTTVISQNVENIIVEICSRDTYKTQ